MDESKFEEGKVSNGDINLHYYAAGPTEGEPVLLLHGFPQYAYMWRHQMAALSAAGYRAIAPDLRGYHLSDRPEAIEAYKMRPLLSDVSAFYKAFGWSKANLVVHDWGALIGWVFAAYQPEAVDRMVVVDCPHPNAYDDALRKGFEQLSKSWYAWLFQAPEIPEQFFGGENIDRLLTMCFGLGNIRNHLTAEDLGRYREMLSQPGQLTAAFNYYRNNFDPKLLLVDGKGQLPLIQNPVLLIYGKDDFAISSRAWASTPKYCAGPFRVEPLEGIGHWACEEAPEVVNKLILEHLAS